MKVSNVIFSAVLLVATSLALFGATPDVDQWVYSSSKGKVAITYNGDPIRFVAEVGDGAFDRPFNLHPSRRLVFIDTRLSLDDAMGVVAFWKAFDPRTPCEFVVISKDGVARRFPDCFERTNLPAEVVRSVAKRLD